MNEYEKLDVALAYLNEGVLSEASIKEFIKNVIDNIKKTIVKLIDVCQEKIKTFKDSKVKSVLQDILSKLRSLLTKSDSISSKEEADAMSKEISDIKENIKHPFSNEFINAVKNDNKLKVHILIGDIMLIDFKLAEEMMHYDVSENGNGSSKYSLQDVKDAENDAKNDEDLLNSLLVLFKQDSGYSQQLISRIKKLISK